MEVVHAPGEGDDTIAAIAQANAEVVGPSWLLDQLVD